MKTVVLSKEGKIGIEKSEEKIEDLCCLETF